MKGFIDRVFLPGIIYVLNENNGLIGLLNGRSARIICTSDMTAPEYEKHYDNTGFMQLKKGTLETCGISPVVTTFSDRLSNLMKNNVSRGWMMLRFLPRKKSTRLLQTQRVKLFRISI